MIKINNLNFSYEDENTLTDISFIIEDGDYLAIVGGNGTGKSTLIKCLIGINKVKEGMIKIDDIDINKFRKFKEIGYVRQTQNKHLDIPITGREYLSLVSKNRKKIEEIAKMLNLNSFIDENINNLSGGQKQRINIAKSLLHDIKYLILDEPNTGLDFNARSNFYDLVAKLNNEHKITIIIVSHHIDEISCKINKVYDLESKKIEENDQDGCQYC